MKVRKGFAEEAASGLDPAGFQEAEMEGPTFLHGPGGGTSMGRKTLGWKELGVCRELKEGSWDWLIVREPEEGGRTVQCYQAIFF